MIEGPQAPAELEAAAAVVRTRLDAWQAAVVGVAAESDDAEQALADPRLEAADDEFWEACRAFRQVANGVLGVEEDHEESHEEDGGDLPVDSDEFYLQFTVWVPPDRPPDALDDVISILDEAGFALVERLFDAGFLVSTWGVGRREPEHYDEEEGEEADGQAEADGPS